jgi:hypothetical protein
MSGNGRRKRAIAVFGAAFALSTAIPILASVSAGRPPLWAGLIDVALAFGIVAGGLFLLARAKGPFDDRTIRTTYRIFRGLASVPLVLLALFFVAGGAVQWDVLLVGLAWRAWLLVQVLPAVVAGWRPP